MRFSLHSKTRLLVVPSVQESPGNPVRTKGFFRQESRWEGISKPILKGTTKEETTRFIQMIGMNIYNPKNVQIVPRAQMYPSLPKQCHQQLEN